MVAGGMDDLSVFRDKLISLVDLLPDESAKVMDQRPRFAHAVLVLANQDLPGEILKANYIKQLDPYWIQTKGTPISSPSQPIQLFNQQSLHLETSNQDTQTVPSQWSSNLEDKMAGPDQKMTSSETSGVCSGGEDISQSPPLSQPIEVPIELKPAFYPVPSQPQEVHIKNVAVVREEEQESGGGLLGRAVNRTQAAARSPATKVVEIRGDTVADLRPLEQVYTETHIKRQKITRYHSDAEDHLPHYKPVSRQRYSPANPDDPIIREAIRILEASCQLLDETAIRIAAVNYENQMSSALMSHKFDPSCLLEATTMCMLAVEISREIIHLNLNLSRNIGPRASKHNKEVLLNLARDATICTKIDEKQIHRRIDTMMSSALMSHKFDPSCLLEATTMCMLAGLFSKNFRYISSHCLLTSCLLKLNPVRPSRGSKENRSFRFPSEIRRNHGLRSNAESPNQPFAQSTTTTTTKLIKETLTTTNY